MRLMRLPSNRSEAYSSTPLRIDAVVAQQKRQVEPRVLIAPRDRFEGHHDLKDWMVTDAARTFDCLKKLRQREISVDACFGNV